MEKESLTDVQSDLSTATLSDAMDRLGVRRRWLAGIRPMDWDARIAGRAFTVRNDYCGAPGRSVGDYVDEVPQGGVIVIANDGRIDASVWGDMLTLVAQRRGVAGTVIDGACRCGAATRTAKYPVFCRDVCMQTGRGRVEVKAVAVEIVVSGVVICPDDLVVGDGDGVLVVPRAHEEEVFRIATEIKAREDGMRAALARGERMEDVRRKYNYFQMVSPTK